MKYKYYTFSSLPRKDKRLIAMAFRAYLLSLKVQRGKVRVEFQPAVKPSSIDFGLPKEAIKEFKKICEHKGLHLSDVEAAKEAHNLINLFMVLGKKNNSLSL